MGLSVVYGVKKPKMKGEKKFAAWEKVREEINEELGKAKQEGLRLGDWTNGDGPAIVGMAMFNDDMDRPVPDLTAPLGDLKEFFAKKLGKKGLTAYDTAWDKVVVPKLVAAGFSVDSATDFYLVVDGNW